MNDIRDGIEIILYFYQYYRLVNRKKIRPIRLNESLLVSSIKGWLFNFYFITTDYQNYDHLNKKSFEYKNWIRKDIMTVDIVFRNWIRNGSN